MIALETAGKKDQIKAAKGQLTSAQGKFEGAALSFPTPKSTVLSMASSPTGRSTPAKRRLPVHRCW